MKLNPEGLNTIRNQVNAAFVATVQEFAATCQEHITDERWDWPRPPSPRDIVDTGRLRDSQSQPFYEAKSTGLQATIRWNPVDPETGEGYAYKVWAGEVVNGQIRPGRPWTETAIEEMGNRGFGGVFEREAKRFVG
ncbi:MAG: hypothetical protein ACKPCP_36440 [Sphaerospermopsis kisseleviana]